MGFETIIGIILFFLVGVWFIYEITSFIRMIIKRIRLKKSSKEVNKNADDIRCDDTAGNTKRDN